VICPELPVVWLIVVGPHADVQVHLTMAPGMGPSTEVPSQCPLPFVSPAIHAIKAVAENVCTMITTEVNGIRLVVFDMNNMIFGHYLAAIDRSSFQ
jgi:hypothetical protein